MFYPRFKTHYANSFLRDLRSLQRVANRIYDLDAAPDSNSAQLEVNDSGADIYLQLPGYVEDQLQVEAIRDRITVTAKADENDESESDGSVVQRHIARGSFERRFQLPFAIDPSSSKATFEDGILHLSFQKPASQQARSIPIDAA